MFPLLTSTLKNSLLCRLIAIFIVFSAFQVSRTDGFIEKVTALLYEFYQQLPQEKAYLHFDKPYYSAGEKIWFKAYLANENSDTTDLSKILYVELISPQNIVLQRLTLSIDSLSTFGDFTIADTLSAGTYRVRAYTNYMQNFGEAYFYTKPIQILNVEKAKSFPQPAKDTAINEAIDLQFFPEGGDLVCGMRNTVAFKASNKLSMKGIDIEGFIYDQEGNKSAFFKSTHLGMGTFKMSPMQGKTYTAKVQMPNGELAIFPLSKSLEKGFMMNITHVDKENLKIQITHNLATEDKKAKEIFLVAQAKGEVYFSAKDNSGNNSLTTLIPKNILPTGIIHFTLFDGYGVPHCERLVFVNRHDFLEIQMGKNKAMYAPREKAKITFAVSDIENNSIEGDFSVAIINEDLVKPLEQYEDNLLSNFLLSSELKGYIENPAYYFQKNISTDTALDYLMLTQGWRRFKWKDLLNKQSKIAYPIEQSLSLSGTVTDKANKPISNGNIIIYARNEANNVLTTTTDSLGRFLLSDLDFTDTVSLAIQATTDKGKKENVNLLLAKKTYPTVSQLLMPKWNEIIADSNFVQNRIKEKQAEQAFKIENNAKLLKAVEVKAKKFTKRSIAERRTIKVDSTMVIKSGKNGMWLLQQYVPNLHYKTINVSGANNQDLKANGIDADIYEQKLVYSAFVPGKGKVDKIVGPIIIGQEGVTINNINPFLIERIVVTNGSQIVVYCKESVPVNGLLQQKIEGFYTAKEFYSPNYEQATDLEKIKPDLRTTIYWNPQVKTNKDGIAEISFFCADTPANYKVVIEGRAKNGILGRKEMILEVRK